MKYKFMTINDDGEMNLSPDILRDQGDMVTVFLTSRAKGQYPNNDKETTYKIYRVREKFSVRHSRLEIEPVVEGPVFLNVSGRFGSNMSVQENLKFNNGFQNAWDEKNNEKPLEYAGYEPCDSEKPQKIDEVPEGHAIQFYMHNECLPELNSPDDKPRRGRDQAPDLNRLALTHFYKTLRSKEHPLAIFEQKEEEKKPSCSRNLLLEFARAIEAGKRKLSQEQLEMISPREHLKKPSLERKKSDDFASYSMR